MLKTIDSILLALWKILSVVFKAGVLILKYIVLGINTFMKMIGADHTESPRVNHSLSSRAFSYLGECACNLGKKFSAKMLISRVFRRCIFLTAFMLYLLWSYPPSHWGPWKAYQTGVASYYSDGFWFKKTASGERFLPFLYTAAHQTLPLGITVKVKNLENGEVVYVKINDRGPFVKGRVIDLSSGAAQKIGVYEPGTANVVIYTRKKYK